MSTITINLSDWLFNAGVVGFVNIITHNNEEIYADGTLKYVEQSIIVNDSVLDNFQEKYFKYFIDTYEKSLAWYKVIRIESFIKKHEDDNYCNFSGKDLEVLNEYIGSGSKSGTFKYYITSNSYKAAYQLINNDFDILQEEKKIKSIKLKKGQVVEDKINDIKEVISGIKKIINYFSEEESKKYLAGKNVKYTIIKNGWNGVSFLNSQTKEKNFYVDYKNYFIKAVKEYLEDDKYKYKYSCFNCSNNMKDYKNDLSFLNATGFDTNRKPSHVWNFVNDIAVCPICKLIYSCVPAGISYVYNKGIFINYNRNFESIAKINNNIKTKILEDSDLNQNTTYNAMITALQESQNENNKFALSDIQIVRYENSNGNEKYRFNIISKKLLKILYEVKDDLNRLINAGYKDGNTYFRLYEETIKGLLNNQNLFLLIHKLLVNKISKSSEIRYHLGHIGSLLRINTEYLKGVNILEKIEKDKLKKYRGAGYHLWNTYVDKKVRNKLNGISYKLLNALKTNNKGMFMDTILNCYLYIKKQVPGFLTECLKDNETFKTVGYAFVSGLIDSAEKKRINEEEK